MMVRNSFGALLVLSLVAGDAAKPAASLPPEWHGTWSGKLAISGMPNGPTELPIVLKIEPIKGTHEFTWVIVYGEGTKATVRDYKLVPDSEKPDRFRIDERNGIVLDARLCNGVMFTQFEVSGSWLTARYELRGDTLRFEVTTAKPASEKTGDGKVQGYRLEIVQMAEMRKKPNPG